MTDRTSDEVRVEKTPRRDRRAITLENMVDRARDDILARLAHEMKNPLAVIQGFASTLRDQRGKLSQDDVDKVLDGMLRGVRTLRTMVDALQETHGVDRRDVSLALSETDIGAVVVETVDDLRLLTDPHHLTITELDEVTAVVDKAKLRQIITNLVTNAAKFSPPEGRIDIRISRSEEKFRIEVQDQGHGISPEDQKRLFQKYERLDAPEKGTGLGLYISRGIALAHGGDLSVVSDGKTGSCFTLELPLDAREGSR